MNKPLGRMHLSAGLVVAGALLSACAMSDEKLSRFVVAPDKFLLYTCPEIADKNIELATKKRELEALMAKAGQSADGRLVSTMAYRPDYVSVNGEIDELRKTAAEKNCPLSDAPPNPRQTAQPKR